MTDETTEPERTRSEGYVNAEPVGNAGVEIAIGEAAVRTGSPFAVDPPPTAPERFAESVIDGGPLQYTAIGAVVAAVMVAGFAAAAAWFFPAGGTIIAALGCALSVFGMSSGFRVLSTGLLMLHLALFITSYGRSLG